MMRTLGPIFCLSSVFAVACLSPDKVTPSAFELVAIGPAGATRVADGFEVEIIRENELEWHWVSDLPESHPGFSQFQEGDSVLHSEGAFRVQAVVVKDGWSAIRLSEALQGFYPNDRYVDGCVALSQAESAPAWTLLTGQEDHVFGLWSEALRESEGSTEWGTKDQVALDFVVWAIRGPEALEEALRFVHLGVLPENMSTVPSRMDFEWGMHGQVLPEVYAVLAKRAPLAGRAGRAALLFSEPQPMVMALAFQRTCDSAAE